MPKEFEFIYRIMKSEKAKKSDIGDLSYIANKVFFEVPNNIRVLGHEIDRRHFFTAYFQFFVIHLLRFFDII